ncbi:20284_t:CDS:2, partial [Rhizophagus irregularis]
KQIERLEEVQRKLKYEDVMRCVQDVQTRWNSSFYAWDHLFYLKDAIIQLQADLYTSTSREDKNDGIKLRKILLSEDEWDLLDKLVDVLLPFEEATREFSGGTYVTLKDILDVENDNEEIISNITKKKISIKDPLNTEGAIEKVKNNIYNALLYYWNIHHDAGLMASLLDP